MSPQPPPMSNPISEPSRFPAEPRRSSQIRRAAASLALGCAAVGMVVGGCSKPAVHYTPNPIGAMPQGSFGRAWLADLPMTNDSLESLYVHGDTLFAFSAKRQVVALDRTAGTIRFVTRVNSPDVKVLPPVQLADQYIFPTALSLEVYDTSGHFERHIPLSVPLRSGAVGQGHTIFFGVDDPAGGRIQCIDLNRNFATERWELLTPGGGVISTPTLNDENVYIGTEAGLVYAITPSRNPLWNIADHIFHTSGPIVADLETDGPEAKFDQAGIYVACRDTKLYCISASTGRLKWQFYAGASLSDPPVVTHDLIYQPIPGMGLAAVDKADPNFNRPARWIYPGATQFLSQDEQYAYLLEPHTTETKSFLHHETNTTRTIVAVNKRTGKKAFESKHSDFVAFGTNPSDNLIYAGYADGVVLAVKPVLRAGQVGELVLVPVPAKLTPLAGMPAVASAAR